MTAALRASLGNVPLLVIDANYPGAGKGKLARALAVLQSGTTGSILTEGSDLAEFEKRLATAILSGSSVVILDNLQKPLSSSTLESILTEGKASIRAFGKLEQNTVECRALFIATMNNGTLRRDQLRRSLTIRIVVEDDKPELRRFDFDPVTYMEEHRMQLLSAAFTVVRGFIQNKEGMNSKTLGSFEDWSKYVAGCVEWLLGKNPIDFLEQRKEQDSILEEEIDAFEKIFSWQEKNNRNEGWRIKETTILGFKQDNNTGIDGNLNDLWDQLIDDLKGSKSSGSRSKRIAGWLRKRVDTKKGSYVLRSKLDRNLNTVKWFVEKLGYVPKAGSSSLNEPIDSEIKQQEIEQGEY
jgi:hypothetical protein